MKKVIYICCAVLLLMSLTMGVSAAENGATLWVKLEVGELPVINGAFTLYRVGTPISDGYRIEENYGGGFVLGEDALSPHLAQWLNAVEEKAGQTILLDVEGNAVFSGLHEGLYLLVQTERTDGFYPIQPLLVSVPWEGQQEAYLYLEPLPMVMDSPPTGQDPAPYIGLIGMVLSLAGLAICAGGGKKWKW